MSEQHALLVNTPALIGFCGDWHGSAKWASSRIMSAAAHGVDVIVQVGDFGIWPGAEGQRYLDRIEKVAARGNVFVVFVDGNHEDHPQLAALPKSGGLGEVRPHIWHLPRGTRWEWGGLRCAALGGATSVDRALRTPGLDWWDGESLTEQDVATFVAGGPCDLAITHDRPAGVNTPGITRDGGIRLWGEDAINAAESHESRLAQALIPTRPALVIHGHLHVRYTATWRYPGGSAVVEGLDCDGSTPEANMILRTVEELKAQVAQIRAG